MSENIIYPKQASREEQYKCLLPQIKALVASEPDLIANLANLAAVLKQAFGFFWVGFYLVKGHELVLGPFQGPVACTRIPFGKGVCGTAWKERRSIIVPDVELFPGHIACSSESKSEIVIPLFGNGEIIGVLDIDSELLNNFNATDAEYLSQILSLPG
ncbi:MAG: GAF domain-containing protein [Dysgonamonadaceae bacterium]|nr:GAF domain-containing protein [Dysgonamonadaceae bacterium]